MARIFRKDIYDLQTLPTFEDYVIGTDPEDSNRTRNFRIADIAALIDGSATTFIALTDTPASYVGEAGSTVIVNATADGLEFGTGIVTTDYYRDILDDIAYVLGTVSPVVVHTASVPSSNWDTNNKLIRFNFVWDSGLVNVRNRRIALAVNGTELFGENLSTGAGEMTICGEIIWRSDTTLLCSYRFYKNSFATQTQRYYKTVSSMSAAMDVQLKLTDSLGNVGTSHALSGYVQTI